MNAKPASQTLVSYSSQQQLFLQTEFCRVKCLVIHCPLLVRLQRRLQFIDILFDAGRDNY